MWLTSVVLISTLQIASCTVQDLAASTQDEVNDMWAGLGYYRRARLLLAGAQHIQSNLSGKMPLTAHELQKIPGDARHNAAYVLRLLAQMHALAGLAAAQHSFLPHCFGMPLATAHHHHISAVPAFCAR